MELTIVVSVLGLDCAQHSSRIAPLNGDRDIIIKQTKYFELKNSWGANGATFVMPFSITLNARHTHIK